MSKLIHIEWADYTIKTHPEHKEGFIVLDEKGFNSLPGAVWFKSVERAKKGIAAHKLAKQTGGDFWMFLELTK